MQQKVTKIPTLIETNYAKSVWCDEILNGIGKKRYSVISFDDLGKYEENSVVVVIGTTNSFFKNAVRACRKRNLRALLVGAEFTDFGNRASSIKTDRIDAISSFVKYLHSNKRDKIALFGIDKFSAKDLEKKEAFIETMKELDLPKPHKHIYYYNENFQNTLNDIFKNISDYNSVICSNDYFAVAFIIEAAKRGVSVPDDIFVTGYGNTYIGEKICPSLTTIAPKYYELGRQASRIYAHLADNADITSLELFIDYDMIIRKSTDNRTLTKSRHDEIFEADPNINNMFDDKEVKPIIGLDSILSLPDKSLIKILDSISNDESYNYIAEKLYLSDSAFRYKLNKIFGFTGASSKKELKELRDSITLENYDIEHTND